VERFVRLDQTRPNLAMTLAEVFDHRGAMTEARLLKSGVAELHETNFDNWNGGTTTYSFVIRVPVSLFAALGTIVPRNAFTQPARNRTAVRLQQRVSLPARVSLDLIAEAFNVFNNGNATINTQENNALYVKPTSGEFRTMQVGFRLMF
jgi:hypothetical protein